MKQPQIQLMLELKTITCPSVWLLPDDPVAVTIHCLGNHFKEVMIKPRYIFPIHKTFVINGHSKQHMTNEIIEISLWQKGRRRAHYQGSLLSLLPSKTSSSVQLSMATSGFFCDALVPRILLAAKIERIHYCRCCQSKVVAMPRTRNTISQRFENKLKEFADLINSPRNELLSCNNRTIKSVSPRNENQEKIYCHKCLQTLTPTRKRGTDQWELKEDEARKCSQCSKLPLNDLSRSVIQNMHSADCELCRQYREFFGIP